MRYLNVILTVLAVLLAANIWAGLSGERGVSLSEARAQGDGRGIPDEGAQRVEIINQLKALNKSVDELLELFKKGKARMTVMETPKAE